MDWKDDVLAKKMQRITGKEEIMLSDVWELTSLSLSGIYGNVSGISDISALSELTNLQDLMCEDNPVEDMSPLETARKNGVSVSDGQY